MPFTKPGEGEVPITEAELDAARRKREEQVGGQEFGQGYTAWAVGHDRDGYKRNRYEADMRTGPDSVYGADQQRAMGQLRAAAEGRVPLAADIAAQQQNSQMAQQLASVAASTRGGPGAQALAARAQAYGTAQGSSQIAQEQAMARAREQAAYRQMYAQTAGAYAGQDLDAQLRQRQINAGREGMYLGAETDARRLQWEDERGQQQFKANEIERNRARTDRYVGMAVQGMSSMMGAGMMSDEDVKENVKPAMGDMGGSKNYGDMLGQSDQSLGRNPWKSGGRMGVEADSPRDWERALELAEEASGTADEKRRIYTTAIDEQNALHAKKDAIDTHLTETRKPLTEAQMVEARSKLYPEWVESQETPGSGRYKLLSDTRAKENRVRAEGAAAMLATIATNANRGANVVASRKGADAMPVSPEAKKAGTVAVQTVSPAGVPIMAVSDEVRAARAQPTGTQAVTPGASKAAQGPTTPMYQRLPPPPEEPTAQLTPEQYYGIVGTQALVGAPLVSDARAKEAERVAAQATAERDRIVSQLRGGDVSAAQAAGSRTSAALRSAPEDARYRHGSPVDALLSTLAKSASTYEYKRPEDQPVSTPRPKQQQFAGVMAQDLERVPQIGSGLVTDTPQGKQVESNAALSALLAAVGRQQQQLQALQEDPRYRHTTPARR